MELDAPENAYAHLFCLVAGTWTIDQFRISPLLFCDDHIVRLTAKARILSSPFIGLNVDGIAVVGMVLEEVECVVVLTVASDIEVVVDIVIMEGAKSEQWQPQKWKELMSEQQVQI
jgi:hypothetical protein